MPTPTKGPRLGGSPAHERLMLANLATSLFEHGRIITTETKAKRLRPLAEKLVTFAKRGDLHARRQVTSGESAADIEAAQEVVADVFAPDGERVDEVPVTPEPTAQNQTFVVSDPNLSPEVAAAAAAEVEPAELGDAASAGASAPGGES